MDATATIAAIPGALCAVAGVPGRVRTPLLLEGGALWLLVYDTPGHALMALRWAALYVRGR